MDVLGGGGGIANEVPLHFAQPLSSEHGTHKSVEALDSMQKSFKRAMCSLFARKRGLQVYLDHEKQPPPPQEQGIILL